ncbi:MULTISPECIES: asparaginase [Micrococcus]|uniref:asparaginase n=1 Tax=Micrococcus yunnanensis TaxID=566027 RepID=A0AAP5T7F4_9MICC|nr:MULTISPECIES: asparaginase [Micrococcus]MBF0756049.1 asparaginase [Micrococcus aloeverae]MCV7455328.1 asparaginase [Micrococcus luteus]MCV7555319.1 asparaginase [Micrococcus luteus]MDV7177427.1 asparaginase [Micrococcus yunnanensis]MEB2537238.1 asparaginase [Micrococcus luteus]
MTRVHVLATGGTIASRSGEGSGATAAHAAEALLAGMDATADVEITGEDVMTVGSYRLGLPELATIARTARERAADPGIDGVVVTHGTDTMEETAFLADLLNGTDTPVVFTGAQRAADHPDTDGPRNLRQAVLAAAQPDARGLGVLIAFDGALLSARGTRKGHTMASQPFTGGTLVGTTHGDGFHLHARPHRPGTLDLPDSGLDGVRVNLVTAHPGADPAALTWAADRGADVVVLAGTGLGNAGPGHAEAVAELADRGVPVVLATRTLAGPVLGVYGDGGGADILAAGAVPAGELTPFQARILAAAVAASHPDPPEFRAQFERLR